MGRYGRDGWTCTEAAAGRRQDAGRRHVHRSPLREDFHDRRLILETDLYRDRRAGGPRVHRRDPARDPQGRGLSGTIGAAEPRRTSAARRGLPGRRRPGRRRSLDPARAAPDAAGRRRGLRPPGRPGDPRAGAGARRADLRRQDARSPRLPAGRASTRCWSSSRAPASACCASRAATRSSSAAAARSSRRWPPPASRSRSCRASPRRLGCAASAGIPLTHREHAQTLVFVTGHTTDGELDLDWPTLARPGPDLVVYMGIKALAGLCRQADRRTACAPTTPAALIENGTYEHQQVVTGTLATLPALARPTAARRADPDHRRRGRRASRARLAWFDGPERAPQRPAQRRRSTAGRLTAGRPRREVELVSGQRRSGGDGDAAGAVQRGERPAPGRPGRRRRRSRSWAGSAASTSWRRARCAAAAGSPSSRPRRRARGVLRWRSCSPRAACCRRSTIRTRRTA